MKRKIAVFDIDGTLYRHSTSYEHFLELIKLGAIPQSVLDEIEPFRRAWDEREHENAFYEHDEAHITAFMRHIEQGIDHDVYYDAARRVIERTGRKTYMYTRRLLQRLQQKGYMTIVLSMSTGALIKPLAEMYAFDIAVCNEELYDELTGEFVGLSINERGIGKGHLLREIIDEYHLSLADSYAIGDTASDQSILEMVAHPIAFNPDKELQRIAIQNGWKIVVERKNTYYELAQRRGTYIFTPPTP